MDDANHLADACRAQVRELGRNPHRAAPPHANTALLEDHLLTTAALVSCLAADEPQRNLLRLAALTHDLPEDERASALGSYAEAAAPWLALLREDGAQLDRRAMPDIPDGPERLLMLAHVAASNRLPVRTKNSFNSHPLAVDLRVDLVYGGATKIKQYVFESARLPEIRGASALLDHINRLDLPALWGLEPLFNAEGDLARAQIRRHQEIRRTTPADTLLDAPECVLYASGGNILALAPAGQGARLAAAIERRYTGATQVAGSVAVAATFNLIELQYGSQPQAFWIDDAEKMIEGSADIAALIAQSYGCANPAANLGVLFGADSAGHAAATQARKGFGELVTLLTAQADRRRAGDGAGAGPARFPVFVDLLSAARRCSSCDVRPAAHIIPPPTSIVLCNACQQKRDVGIAAKKGPRAADDAPPDQTLDWIQPWGDWLERTSKQLQRTRDIKATVNSLPEIAQAAGGRARGFVGLVYADGNNVGAHIAGLATIAAYRRFAQQMLEANEQAVALALLEHLGPGDQKVWPFEIITIGGDDMLLFVPADRAPAVAATIAREFGKAMEKHKMKITLSVGVLLMADHTPVRFARDMVESLLKSAKQRSKDGDKGPTIDFMALKAAGMVSETIASYRSAAFQRVRRRERAGKTRVTRLHLTQRPYTLENFVKLLEAGRALARAQFPQSQLHQLAEIVGEGQQLRAGVDYRYFVGRGRERGRADSPYVIFESAIGALCGSEDSAPWRRIREEPERLDYDTPLLDLVEILPFIGPAEREEYP